MLWKVLYILLLSTMQVSDVHSIVSYHVICRITLYSTVAVAGVEPFSLRGHAR